MHGLQRRDAEIVDGDPLDVLTELEAIEREFSALGNAPVARGTLIELLDRSPNA